MQMGQKYGNGFGSSPSVPVLIEIPNFMIEIWKIVRHHVLVPRPDNGHPNKVLLKQVKQVIHNCHVPWMSAMNECAGLGRRNASSTYPCIDYE